MDKNTKFLQFDVESAEVIEEPIDSRFATARIQAFSSGKNLHGMVCSEEVLQETAPTIFNTPILYTVDKNLMDFYTHVEPDKSLICGFVVPNSAEFVRKEDGRLSLTVLAKIWKKYSPKVIEFFKRDSQNKKRVSVEMELYSTEPRDDGLDNMLLFKYFGVCLIGDFVREASPGANAQILSFSEEQKEYNEAYVAEFADKYSELDFSIPKKVKENVQEGLDLHKKHKRGGTSVSLAVARHFISNEKASSEKIRHVHKHFNLHSSSDFSNKTGKEFIKWQLYGGNEGFSWSKKLVESMDGIDKRKIAFFQGGELVTFPYKRVEDANPSLKSWKPPLSLSQINSIAAQADAIGGEYGWPTAIKHFKETHRISDDGKSWVEKSKEEKMSDEEKLAEEVRMAEEKKLAEAKFAEEEKKKLEDAKFAEDEAKKKAEEEEAKKKEEMAVEEKPFSFTEFANLATYMDEEVEDPACKMASEELKKPEGANFGAVAMGMYAKMCKMSAKVAEMSVEMSALKEFKASIEAQQKQFAVDQTLRELEEKVVIPEDARKAMVEDAEKYSFAEINVWQNNCKAKSFDFAVKISKDGKKPEIKRYAMPFAGIPVRPSNDVWAGAKK